MRIGTIAAGVGTQTIIELNFVPQQLYYVAATQLQSIKVNIAGDGVICDLDATGLTTVSTIRQYGQVTNSSKIPLADGYVPQKVVTLTITNSAAVAITLYGNSQAIGDNYITNLRSTVLANSKMTFKKFAYLGISSPTTNDEYTVEYQNGAVERYESTELPGVLGDYQNPLGVYGIDNVEQNIKMVTVLPDTNRTVYSTRYVRVGNVDKTM